MRQASKASKVSAKVTMPSTGEDEGFESFEGDDETPSSSLSKLSKPLPLRPPLRSL